MSHWNAQVTDFWGEELFNIGIEVDEGTIYVGFWNPNGGFFITTEEELKEGREEERLDQWKERQGMSM